jgi:hypothetical protein
MGGQLPGNTVPHSGSWAVKLGVVDNELASIQQTVTVPANAPYLAYWHWVFSDETANDCFYDYASVLVNDSPLNTFALCVTSETSGWVLSTLDLSAYAGQTVALKFQVLTDGSVTSYWVLDDVSFQSSP